MPRPRCTLVKGANEDPEGGEKTASTGDRVVALVVDTFPYIERHLWEKGAAVPVSQGDCPTRPAKPRRRHSRFKSCKCSCCNPGAWRLFVQSSIPRLHTKETQPSASLPIKVGNSYPTLARLPWRPWLTAHGVTEPGGRRCPLNEFTRNTLFQTGNNFTWTS